MKKTCVPSNICRFKEIKFWNKVAEGYCGSPELLKFGPVRICSSAGDCRRTIGRKEAGSWVVHCRVRSKTEQPRGPLGKIPTCLQRDAGAHGLHGDLLGGRDEHPQARPARARKWEQSTGELRSTWRNWGRGSREDSHSLPASWDGQSLQGAVSIKTQASLRKSLPFVYLDFRL